MVTVFVHIHIYIYIYIQVTSQTRHDVPAGMLVHASFMLHCSMSYGGWIPQDKAQEHVASIECVYRENTPLCCYN